MRFILLIILIMQITISFGMLMNHKASFISQLLDCIKISKNLIYDLEEDKQLFIFIIQILNIPITDDWEYYYKKRQELLKNYIQRKLSKEEDNYTIDVQGKKICAFLQDKIVLDQSLWVVLEESIKAYCINANSVMPAQAHKLCNYNIININKFYTIAKQFRRNYNIFYEDLTVQEMLNNAIGNIYYFYDHIEFTQKKIIEKKSTDTQTERVYQEISIQTEDILVDNKATDTENLTSEVTLQEVKTEQNIPKKQKLTKHDRKKLKACEPKPTEQNIAQKHEYIELTEYQKILNIIENNNIDLFNDKFIQRINQLDNKTEKEDAFYALLISLIKNKEIDKAFKCIQKAPKIPKILIEYLKLITRLGIKKEDFDRFLEYAKICNLSEYRQELDYLIQEIITNTDNMSILLYSAKLEMVVKKNIGLFIECFDKAISENNLGNFIKIVLELGIYKELCKWVNENQQEETKKFENQFIRLINTTITLPITIQKIVNKILDIVVSRFNSQEKIRKKEINNQNLDLETYTKWIKENIKFLLTINLKTNSKQIKTILSDLCITYGHNLFNNFVIPNNVLLEYIKDSFDTPKSIYKIAKNLLKKNNKYANLMALECLRINANKFDDIQSLYLIFRIFKSDKDQKIDPKELEQFARKIISHENPISHEAMYYLALALINKKNNGDTVDINEIIKCLENNPLIDAQILYSELYNNPEYTTLINLSPDILTKIIIQSIKKRTNQNLRTLLICIIELANNILMQESQGPSDAALEYENKKLISPQEELNKLKEKIYKHPLFNKKNGWPVRFRAIADALQEQKPDLILIEFLKEIKVPEDKIENFLCIMDCDLELKENQIKHAQDSTGNTVLHYAVSQLNSSLVQFIINEHPELLDIDNAIGQSPAFSAILSDYTNQSQNEQKVIEIICLLKEKKPKIAEQIDSAKNTLLHKTAQKGLTKVIQYLIKECNADLRILNIASFNPIQLAILNDNLEIIDYLLKEKYLTQKDCYDILIFAAFYNKTQIFFRFFKELISNIKDQEMMDKLIDDIFSMSMNMGLVDLVKYFLENQIIILDEKSKKLAYKWAQRIKNKARELGETDLKSYHELIEYLKQRNDK